MVSRTHVNQRLVLNRLGLILKALPDLLIPHSSRSILYIHLDDLWLTPSRRLVAPYHGLLKLVHAVLPYEVDSAAAEPTSHHPGTENTVNCLSKLNKGI